MSDHPQDDPSRLPKFDDPPLPRDEVDALCCDQRLRWRAGERPSVESYLEKRPHLAQQPESVLELVYNEYLIREELGEAPPSSDFFQRFPDQRAALARQLEVHRALQAEIDTWETSGSSRRDAGPRGAASMEEGAAPPDDAFLAAGAELGAFEGGPRFVIERLLGAGGMGSAYAAFDRLGRRRVALKTLHRRDAWAPLRLKEEFRLLADLVHPNLVQLFELWVEPRRAYFTMELLEGADFVSACGAFRTAPGDSFPEAQARGVLTGLVAGVAALHAAGKVHCDLKPSNVLVDARGKAVVLDFGMGLDLRAAAGGGHGLRGTIAYLPPERLRGGAPSPAGDWYAVGCMLYEVLTGRRPFEGEPGRIVAAKLQGDVAPPGALGSTASPELERLCVEWLSVDPDRRPSAESALRRLGADFIPFSIDAESMATAAARAELPEGDPASEEGELLVGREEALRTLHAALDRASAEGRSERLLVHAAAGGGKSALAARFAAERERFGRGIVLAGRCREHESIPFKAVDALVDDLARRLARVPAEEAAELPSAGLAALADLFPVLQRAAVVAAARRGRAAPVDAVRRRTAAFEALGGVLAAISRRRPLVVWIDDVQWGDPDSARLLVHAMRAAEDSPILWLACCRTDRLADSPFLSELRGALGPAAFREWALPPLSEEAAFRLAVACHPAQRTPEGRAAASADASWIVREAAGNPFHVRELARSLSYSFDRATEKGEFYSLVEGREPSRGPAAPPVPEEVDARMDGLLRRRIERVSAEAARLLQTFCAAGGPLPTSIAAAAAGVEDPREALSELRRGRLVRTWREGGEERGEPAHDRIREGVVRRAASEALRGLHAALAAALESAPNPDPRALARHCAAAGLTEKAYFYSEAAGRAAAVSAAFDEAARHFRTALDQPGFDADRPRLERALADALVGAGRGAEAGLLYRKLAAGRPVAEAAALHAAAVLHLVRSGRFRDGLEAFQQARADLGLACPPTSGGKIRSYLGMRAILALRGIRWVERPASEVDPLELARVDCCWTAGHLMGPTDVAGYIYYTGLHNALAFRCGEPGRVARALACEALIHTYLSDRDFAASRRLLAQASALADRLGDPQIAAAVEMFRAGVWFCAGKWKEVVAVTDVGVPYLRDACEGAGLELGWSCIYRLHAMFYLGRWRDLRREAAACLDDARGQGDVGLGAEVRSGTVNSVWLAADDPDAARRELEQAVRWRPARSDEQVTFLDLVARVGVDLYRGESDAAWRAVSSAWPRLAAARQLQVECIHVELSHLRVRAALAALAAAPPGGSDSSTALHEKSLAEGLSVLMGSSYPWTQGLALLHRSSFASLRGRAEQAAEWLAEAVERLEEAGLALFAAAARWRLGELRGGTEGEDRVEAARGRFLEEGVRRPEFILRFLAPGFRRD